MKACLKSQPEPACLKVFREVNPRGSWEEFRNEARECYSKLRDMLNQDQGGLCAYCEMDVAEDNAQIAHFHPKSDSGACNWALKWTNLWLACRGGTQSWLTEDPANYLPPLPENRSCDEAKADRILDGQILSPSEIQAFPRIVRFEQWPNRVEIQPDPEGCHQARIDPEKVKATIDKLNLNCARLAEARLRCLRQWEQQIKRLRLHSPNEAALYKSFVENKLTKNVAGRWTRFFTLARWRFRTMAEDYLRATGYTG